MVQDIDVNSPFGTYQANGLVRLLWQLVEWRMLALTVRKTVRGIVGRFFGGPYDEEVEGIRFRIYPTENYDDRKIFAKGRLPEQQEHEILEPHLKPGVTFVDIGANIGTYALFAAGLGASVVAIEANPASAKKLSYNIRANNFENILVYNTAVGGNEGKLKLWSVASNSGFATLVKGLTKDKWKGNWQAQEVSIQPLKDVLDDCEMNPDIVMKVDVEGFEDRVLIPYLSAAKPTNWPNAILIETNCRKFWETDVLEYLTDAGYETVGRTGDNMMMVHRNAQYAASIATGVN